MTNQFHLSFDSWGTRLVALAMFAFLATNTWHFIGTFIPQDTWYHRPLTFLFFEGGLVYWFNRLEHASENVGKTIIAAFMTLVQLAAVGFATFYELSVGFQQMMGVHMDASVQFAMPFVVTGLIILWIIAWALGRLMNEHFAQRMRFIAKNGVSPHLVASGHIDRIELAGANQNTKALPSGRARDNIKALPQATSQQGELEELPVPQSVAFLQRVGGRIGNWLGLRRVSADDTNDAAQVAVLEDTSESSNDVAEERAEVQYSVASQRRQPAARTRSSSNANRARRSSAQIDRVLTALDKAEPGQSDASLARAAGCSTSTVSRWRKQ